MKFQPPYQSRQGYTLSELLVATSLTAVITCALLAVSIFGMRMATSAGVKLQANDDARLTLTRIMQDIKGTYAMQVGEGDVNTFSPVGDARNQAGNALQLYPSTNWANYVRYYYVSNTLCRTDGKTVNLVTSHSITNFTGNQPIFTEENLSGQPLTNLTALAPVHIRLSFIVTNRALLFLSGSTTFFQVETCATPREF